MAGDRYWANIIAALLIANTEEALELANQMVFTLRQESCKTATATIYPMAAIGLVEAGVWMYGPVCPKNDKFLDAIPELLGTMMRDYTNASGIGMTTCSDWAAGAFSSTMDRYFGRYDRTIAWEKAKTMFEGIASLRTIREGSIRLFDEFAYKLFRQLFWTQKLRALSHGFKSLEPLVEM